MAASNTGWGAQLQAMSRAGIAGRGLPWAVWWESFNGVGTRLVRATRIGAGLLSSAAPMIVAHLMAASAHALTTET